MGDALRMLVARIQRGDREALSDFVVEYGDYIRGLAQRWIAERRVEQETEPDEILAATAWELMRRAGHIEAAGPGEFLSYVECIVRSQVYAIWRRRQAHKRGNGRPTWQGADRLELVDSRCPRASDAELEEWIARTYETLTGLERLIAMLRRADWTWEEIAGRLNSTAEAVRKRWERAVGRARRQTW